MWVSADGSTTPLAVGDVSLASGEVGSSGLVTDASREIVGLSTFAEIQRVLRF
jgi:hypothetical protein